MRKRPFLQALGSSLLLSALPTAVRAQARPVVVGSSLSLTGPLAGTAVLHKLAAEIYLEQVNRRGGWLGRPVEWRLSRLLSDGFAYLSELT